jgi:hypothetical protein
VVDDVQGTVYGHLDQVQAVAAQSCSFLVQALEDEGLSISVPKVQLVGSTPQVVRRISRVCLPLRKATKRSVRNLGADFAGGRRLHHHTRGQRVLEVLRRARRLRTLGRFGHNGLHIAKVGLGPSGLFAVAVTGNTPKHLARIRHAFHFAAAKKHKGRSVTVDLAVKDKTADPAYTAMAAPIAWLCKEIFSKSSPSIMVRDCVAAAAAGIKASGKDSGESVMHLATGPVSTAVCAAHGLGWSNLRDLIWVTSSGHELNLATADPFTVKKMAEQEVKVWLWRRAAMNHTHLVHLDAPPFLDRVHKLLADQSDLDAKQKGLLKACLSGAFFRSDQCQ